MRKFVVSAFVIIILAALLKLRSSFGTAHYLDETHPLFLISNRNLFRVLAFSELSFSIIGLSITRPLDSLLMVNTFANCALFYRIVYYLSGARAVCPCLGSPFAWSHLTANQLDSTAKWLLAYLLVGSYLWLFQLYIIGSSRLQASGKMQGLSG